MAVVRGAGGDICTHKRIPCNTWQDWLPGGTCCLNAGGNQTYREASFSEIRDTVPNRNGLQCGALFRSVFLLPCSQYLGGCGGPQDDPDCM